MVVASRPGSSLRGSPQVATGLIGDVVDLLLGRLQRALRLRGPLSGPALPPGRYPARSRCPFRSPEPAHGCLIPFAVSCATLDYPLPTRLCGALHAAVTRWNRRSPHRLHRHHPFRHLDEHPGTLLYENVRQIAALGQSQIRLAARPAAPQDVAAAVSHGRFMPDGRKSVNFDPFSSAEHGSSVKVNAT
jgi:hypothetical protein